MRRSRKGMTAIQAIVIAVVAIVIAGVAAFVIWRMTAAAAAQFKPEVLESKAVYDESDGSQAIYIVLRNGGTKRVRLIAVDVVTSGGKKTAPPSGGAAAIEPGLTYVIKINPASLGIAMTPAETVTVNLRFDDGTTVPVSIESESGSISDTESYIASAFYGQDSIPTNYLIIVGGTTGV
ncbi:MAG: hypothetical protein DRJ40_05825 [Thermoprotei archaeon]|nr:MAG: hypothetical protein DRJ40_05825 [Thermoprotei archaeon]